VIKFLHKLFNYHKIDELERVMETYRARNQQLEEELREYKGYKLKYELAELYVNDDEALLEIFEAAEEKASEKAALQQSQQSQQRQLSAMGVGGLFGGLAGQAAAGSRFY